MCFLLFVYDNYLSNTDEQFYKASVDFYLKEISFKLNVDFHRMIGKAAVI